MSFLRSLALLLAVQLLAAPGAHAVQEAAVLPPSLDDWIAYYYLEKDPAPVSAFLRRLQEEQVFDKKPGASLGLVGFLAAIFAGNPPRVEEWSRCAPFEGTAREAVQTALWLSGNGKLVPQVFNESPEILQKTPGKLVNVSIRQPGDLDVVWGMFYATGNDTFVAKILNVLDEGAVLSGNAKTDAATRQVAAASLAGQLSRHELVNRCLVRELAHRQGKAKARIEAILAEGGKDYRQLPTSTGDFSAAILLASEEQLKQKPQLADLKPMASVKRGEPLVLSVLFAGMELKQDLRADVGYTVRIEKPDGSVYYADAKPQQAVKRKVPARFRICAPDAFMKIGFSPEDPAGAYTFVVEITDNVGNRSLRLEQKVELAES